MKEQKFDINPHLNTVRNDFSSSVLLEENCQADPFLQFEIWLREAVEADSDYANAMMLSTIDNDGIPDSRIVLLRNISYSGFTFFTNYQSSKGKQLAHHSQACLLFFWKELQRQVKVKGEIRFLPGGESDSYFASRPFESQVGAWASQQSQVIADRKSLDARYDQTFLRFKDTVVPRPSHWGGYVLLPTIFEFWQGRQSRLHDRLRYSSHNSNGWKIERLMP